LQRGPPAAHEAKIIRNFAAGVKLDFLTPRAQHPYDAQGTVSGADFHVQHTTMSQHLNYGLAARLDLELPSGAVVCGAPRSRACADVAAAVQAALAAPLEFPNLSQAALPGDRVVLALEAGVPGVAAIVAHSVDELVRTGVDPQDIVVLSPHDQTAVEDPLAALSPALRGAVAHRVHDPLDRDWLSYLAASGDARPIYINRLIHDADLVISIGVLRLADSLGYYGINTALFPAFSDAATLERYRTPKAAGSTGQNRLRRQADEVGWLVGLQFTIQVVPGSAGEVLHVVAGSLDAVRAAGRRLCETAWSYQVPERVALVVATIEGGPAQQTWQNVGRALAAAAGVLDEDGAIVILSELAEPPGPGLRRIMRADDLERAVQAIAGDPPVDALAATQLARALQRGKVYLVSRLADDLVEDLGMLPVDERGVARAIGRYPTCLVLANSPFAAARQIDASALTEAAGEPPARS
jgi:nickel-dependent lactate racemase